MKRRIVLATIWTAGLGLALFQLTSMIHRTNRFEDRTHGEPAPPAPYAGARPKRVVVIAVDTLRADHVSGLGYARRTTPNLDRLAAREAVLFTNAHSPSSWTLPSTVSLLTSLYPNAHEVEDREQTLHPAVPTLAGAFSGSRWHTAAFVTHIYVSSLFGIDNGFDQFEELSIDWKFREGFQLRADELNRAVMPWLAKHREERFFLYLHYFDPHWDYDPPSPFDKRFTDPGYRGPATGSWLFIRQFLSPKPMAGADMNQVIGLYDGEIAYTDHHLGRLFRHMRSLGIWDDTLLVVLSDHGEEFKDHGSMHHIRTLYQEVIHVPLIVKPPGGRPAGWPTKVRARVSTVDVGPTLLDMAGVTQPPSFQGRSLVPLMKSDGPDRPIFARTMRHRSDKMSLIVDGKKLILPFGRNSDPPEYYDLDVDPDERRSIARTYPGEVAYLREQMKRHLENNALSLGLPGAGREAELTEDQKTLLKNLGYME